MSNWLQNQFKVAEGLLEAVDRTAKHASKKDLLDESKRSSTVAPDRQSKPGSHLESPTESSAKRRGAVEKQEQFPWESPASPTGTLKLSQPPVSVKTEPPSPTPIGPIAEATARAPDPAAASQAYPRDLTPSRGLSPPPLASLFGTSRSSSSEQQPWHAETGASPRSQSPLKPKPQPQRAATREPASTSRSPERGRNDERTSSEPHDTTTSTREGGQEVGGAAVEPSSPSRDVGDGVGGVEMATEEPRGASPEAEVQHEARAAFADPYQAGYVKGDPPGAEGFSEVDLNGNKDKLHLSPGLAEPHIPVDDVPALESAPQPLPPPEEIPDPERKAEVPKNTADAVAEAIKAATAIAKGTESGEEMEGGEDARVRESRLVKMVEGLKRRLEQLKAENEQLEELLHQADARVSGRSGDVGRLEDSLAKALAAQSTAAAELIEEKRARAVEAGSLKAALEVARGRVSEVQRRMASVEENNERLLQEQEISEARMVSMLREEVSSLERRLEDERFAAASARQSFAAREQELEAALSEGGSALAKQQRAVEERARRLTAAENRAAMLEAEKADLQNELEAQMARQPPQASGGSPAEASEVQRLREGSASLQAALTNTQAQRRGLEGELSTLRNEVDVLRNQIANAPNTLQLERRLQEVTDLLYQKQSQVERVTAERAAQQMAWERELAAARDTAERTQRRSKTERAGGFVDGDMVVPMEDMGETYQRLANDKRVGKAVKAGAKFLDATTTTAVRFLRHYPLGRLLVLAYIIFIHLFVYTLIHSLQQQALHVEHTGLRLDDN